MTTVWQKLTEEQSKKFGLNPYKGEVILINNNNVNDHKDRNPAKTQCRIVGRIN